MSDPYRLSDSATPATASPRRASGGHTALRLLLWPVAIGGAGANTIMNFGGTTVLGILAGSISVLAVVGLVISYVSTRKRK
ncbi:hypothetical protein Afil01_03550 [Actinorhabdospora filicis]|uniref:Uncharacterized protein n=1 Tax=Actinorhabdospora filicis TaxID=1785913 RepID=A0A9W6W730_9ACTN|nr:hypothetical protein [Actinorhabdospora filicis]GLZ75548.1 hypothetical protein Afil01_03550 [Actinorhabdospora filicis]